MADPPRNSPCPCGSGKKYKKCCFGKVVAFPGPSRSVIDAGSELMSAREVNELVSQDLSRHDFQTLDELNRYLKKTSTQLNRTPKIPFLGLSSEQMQKILYSPFTLDNVVCAFREKDPAHIDSVPIVKQSLYFLNRLKNDGNLKATQKGKLPRAFVKELHHEFFSRDTLSFIPNNEGDSVGIVRLRHLLTMARFVKKRENKFSLTKRGLAMLSKDPVALYQELFLTYANKLNWAYADLYPDFQLIQHSLAFNLLIIFKKAMQWTWDKELGEAYAEAFPVLADESSGMFETPEEEIASAFCVRFLDRFCIPMGLLDVEEEGKAFKFKRLYKVTPFFSSNFLFTAR